MGGVVTLPLCFSYAQKRESVAPLVLQHVFGHVFGADARGVGLVLICGGGSLERDRVLAVIVIWIGQVRGVEGGDGGVQPAASEGGEGGFRETCEETAGIASVGEWRRVRKGGGGGFGDFAARHGRQT